MTRYFAGSAATRKNAPLRTGYADIDEAKAQAAFLADTYGGIGKVTDNTGALVAKYSNRRGWH